MYNLLFYFIFLHIWRHEMKFGVLLPNCALSFPWATAEELIEAAKIAEDLESTLKENLKNERISTL